MCTLVVYNHLPDKYNSVSTTKEQNDGTPLMQTPPVNHTSVSNVFQLFSVRCTIVFFSI